MPASDPDEIYYIKWTKPHLKQAMIMGPFYPMAQALMRLLVLIKREKSEQGEQLIDDIVSNGGEAAINGLERFNAILSDGNIMKIQIVREKNAAVARVLPGEVGNDAFP